MTVAFTETVTLNTVIYFCSGENTMNLTVLKRYDVHKMSRILAKGNYA